MITSRVKKIATLGTFVFALLLPTSYGLPLSAATLNHTMLQTVQQTDGAVRSASNSVKASGNLYAGPSPLYPVVDSIDEGTEITLIGQTPYRRWFQLENETWIQIDMLAEKPPWLPYVSAPLVENLGDEEMATAPTDAADDEAADEVADDEVADDEVVDDQTDNDVLGDIVEVASTADGFTTLVTAIEVAGLVDTFKGDGPFTVFAPTDEAFGALPDGILDALLADPEQLTEVLLYHIILGERIVSDDMSDGLRVETAQGTVVKVDNSDSGLTINESKIVVADIAASNGIIHVTDSVLLPPDYEVTVDASTTADDTVIDDEVADDEVADNEAADSEAADDKVADDEAADDEVADDEIADDAVIDEPSPEPIVSVPSSWTVLKDSTLGYSLAVPPGWTELDLRGTQLVSLATMFGQGDAAADLQTFLDTEDGRSIGVVALTDISNTFTGGVPTLLNVSVVGAPEATPEQLLIFVNRLLEENTALLGDVDIGDLTTGTTNNLPSVVGTGTADLADVGISAEVGIKVAGLIYQEKIYMITVGTQLDDFTQSQPIFDEIIGTLKPE